MYKKGVVKLETLVKAVSARVPQGTEELNVKAVHFGYQAAQELLQRKSVK